MERINVNFKVSDELEYSLEIKQVEEEIKYCMAYEFTKELTDKSLINIKKEADYLSNKYSSEILVMKPEELKDILECLRRIYAQTNNFYVQTNVKEIVKILGLK